MKSSIHFNLVAVALMAVGATLVASPANAAASVTSGVSAPVPADDSLQPVSYGSHGQQLYTAENTIELREPEVVDPGSEGADAFAVEVQFSENEIEAPEVRDPEVDTGFPEPEFEIPEVNTPDIETPEFNTPEVPSVPETPSIPEVNTPET